MNKEDIFNAIRMALIQENLYDDSSDDVVMALAKDTHKYIVRSGEDPEQVLNDVIDEYKAGIRSYIDSYIETLKVKGLYKAFLEKNRR